MDDAIDEDMEQVKAAMRYPLKSSVLRAHAINNDRCPQCGGDLDVGWECSNCAFDAREEVLKYTNKKE